MTVCDRCGKKITKKTDDTRRSLFIYSAAANGIWHGVDLCEDCLYKLEWCSLNSVKQGKAIEAVPVLNPQEIEENAERLEVMPNEKDEAIKSSTKAGHCPE